MAPDTQDRLIGKKELSKFLGVSVGTVTRMVTTGTGPRYYRIGLFVKFMIRDVYSFLEERAVEPRGRRAG
jgi:predicted DNA-binding transcriptional regulator AlpA